MVDTLGKAAAMSYRTDTGKWGGRGVQEKQKHNTETKSRQYLCSNKVTILQ